MIVLLVLAALASVILVFINAVGAWAVSRRKPLIAVLFLVAASFMAVGFGGLVGFFPYTRVILGMGLFLSWLGSFLYAHVVLGDVVWRFHVIRALVFVVVYFLADFGLA